MPCRKEKPDSPSGLVITENKLSWLHKKIVIDELQKQEVR
jgi:hypothetical protein